MTPLGRGILTGMPEVGDPLICDAMDQMMDAASEAELGQTVRDMGATITALCGALGDSRNTSASEVLQQVLAG